MCFSKCCKRVPRVDLRRKLPPSKESVNKELLQHLEGHQSDVYAPVVKGSESTGQTNTVDTKAYDNMLLNDGKNSPTYIYTALLHKNVYHKRPFDVFVCWIFNKWNACHALVRTPSDYRNVSPTKIRYPQCSVNQI